MEIRQTLARGCMAQGATGPFVLIIRCCCTPDPCHMRQACLPRGPLPELLQRPAWVGGPVSTLHFQSLFEIRTSPPFRTFGSLSTLHLIVQGKSWPLTTPACGADKPLYSPCEVHRIRRMLPASGSIGFSRPRGFQRRMWSIATKWLQPLQQGSIGSRASCFLLLAPCQTLESGPALQVRIWELTCELPRHDVLQ
jgi:hypothetical protein